METILIAALEGFIGLLRQLITNLLGNDAELWGNELKKFLRKEPCWLSPATNAMATVKEAAKKVVRFVSLPSVTSNGLDGKKSITRLEGKKFRVGDWAKNVLTVGKDAQGNLAFVATNGVTYKPVVIKGEEFTDDERVTSNIRKVAEELHLVTPPAELAPLLREALSDEEIEKMGLVWLVVMHEPIADCGGGTPLLGLFRDDDGRWLYAYWDEPGLRWHRQVGFVFLAPQVGTQD